MRRLTVLCALSMFAALATVPAPAGAARPAADRIANVPWRSAGRASAPTPGGASTMRQALIAGVIDELTLDVAPVLLGSGERIFDGVESFEFEPVEVLHSPLATHIRYRRAR